MEEVAQSLSRSLLCVGRQPVHGCAFLAPLSGVTDVGMRRAAQTFGAPLVVSEMVAADAYIAADEEARLRAEGSGLSPHVVQIAGRSPDTLAEAARLAEAAGADIIDINMGCPAKRVVGGYAGSALMREPDLAARLVRAVVAAVQVPVTVKMRLGWDETSRNAPELASHLESEGAAMITVHGRTRRQFYKGQADWPAIHAVRDAISVPLVANGDCRSMRDASVMLDQSGADAVMVGRAAVGRPWIVGMISDGLKGHPIRAPSASRRRDAALAHYESLLSTMGRTSGVRHARKHLVAYAKAAAEDGFAIAPALSARLATSDDVDEVTHLLSRIWDEPATRAAA